MNRREQNIFRLFGSRVRAGDRAPDGFLETQEKDEKSGRLFEQFNRLGICFKALLFESDGAHKQKTDVRLPAIAAELEKSSLGLISCVVIPSSNTNLRQRYGVLGQAIFLVRPDGYIGFRGEPITVNSVLYYLRNRMHMTELHTDKPEANSSDWVPKVVFSAVAANTGALLWNLFRYGKKGFDLNRGGGFAIVLGAWYLWASVTRLNQSRKPDRKLAPTTPDSS